MASDDTGNVGNSKFDRLRQQKPAVDTLTIIAILTLRHNSTVTSNNVYWEDDPNYRVLTKVSVEAMNTKAKMDEFLMVLRLLVCQTGDLIALEYDVELGRMMHQM